MSCIDWPRTASGLCSPSAQRTASVTFDLPLPFGPTITLTPGPNSSSVRSGNDLKPLRVIDFRYMAGLRASAAARFLHPLQCLSCGFLLGFLLAATASAPDQCAVHLGHGLEAALVGRPCFAHDPVRDELAPLRQPLLQLALEVRHVRD